MQIYAKNKINTGDPDMKKTLSVLVIAMLCIVPLIAAGAKEKAADTTDYSAMSLADLKAAITTVNKGTFTVATSPDFAPYEFYAIVNGTPELAGFDIYLAQYIADYLGLELEVIPMDFDGTLMEVQNRNVDAGISGYSPTPERAEVMELSSVYYTGGQSFVTTKEKASNFSTLEDTNNSKYRIGAQIGSIQVGLAKEFSPNSDIIELSKVTDIIAELLNGMLDGAYIEGVVAESYKKNYPNLEIVLPVPYDAEGSVIGITKGNMALLEGVNRAIAQALADGSMAAFIQKADTLASGDIIEGLL